MVQGTGILLHTRKKPKTAQSLLMLQHNCAKVVNENQGARWYCVPHPSASARTDVHKCTTLIRTKGNRMFNGNAFNTVLESTLRVKYIRTK